MQNRNYRNEYISGNTARAFDTMPFGNEVQPRKKQPLTKEEFLEQKRREQVANGQRAAKRTEKAVHSMDFVSLLVLSAAIILTLYVCVSYLYVQSQITSTQKDIAKIESQIVDLRAENDTTLERINTGVDLSYVYKVATKELGMVHAGKNQVVTYENAKSDYVRKYADIPDVQKSSMLEKIFNK